QALGVEELVPLDRLRDEDGEAGGGAPVDLGQRRGEGLPALGLGALDLEGRQPQGRRLVRQQVEHLAKAGDVLGGGADRLEQRIVDVDGRRLGRRIRRGRRGRQRRRTGARGRGRQRRGCPFRSGRRRPFRGGGGGRRCLWLCRRRHRLSERERCDE